MLLSLTMFSVQQSRPFVTYKTPAVVAAVVQWKLLKEFFFFFFLFLSPSNWGQKEDNLKKMASKLTLFASILVTNQVASACTKQWHDCTDIANNCGHSQTATTLAEAKAICDEQSWCTGFSTKFADGGTGGGWCTLLWFVYPFGDDAAAAGILRSLRLLAALIQGVQ